MVVQIEPEYSEHVFVVLVPTEVHTIFNGPGSKFGRIVPDGLRHRINEPRAFRCGDACVGPQQVAIRKQVSVAQQDRGFDKCAPRVERDLKADLVSEEMIGVRRNSYV